MAPQPQSPDTLEDEQPAVVSPARPVARTQPAPIIDIPAGSPRTAALSILARLQPGASGQLGGRLASIETALGDLVEEARLRTDMSLDDFLARASRSIKLRATLEARLSTMDPSASVPARPAVEVDVYSAVKEVRRWSAGHDLRDRSAAVVGPLRAARDGIKANIQGLAQTYATGGQFAIDNANAQLGLGSQQDEFVLRLEGLISQHQGITARIDRLDPDGDAGRSVGVKAAVEAAGGGAVVQSLIQGSMTSQASAQVQATKAAIAKLDNQLATVDSATRKAAALRKNRDDQAAKLTRCQAAVVEQQAAAAWAIVANAGTGDHAAIATLAATVQPFHRGLSDALSLVRGGEDALIATVGELIGTSTEALP